MESYNETDEPIDPPEIRHPREMLTSHEFYVDLGEVRPDVRVMEMMTEWLGRQAPQVPFSINFCYYNETENAPAILEALLILGGPVDLG